MESQIIVSFGTLAFALAFFQVAIQRKLSLIFVAAGFFAVAAFLGFAALCVDNPGNIYMTGRITVVLAVVTLCIAEWRCWRSRK